MALACVSACAGDSGLQASEDMEPHDLVGWLAHAANRRREHARLQPQRQPDVRLLSAGFPDESCWRHADDCDCRAADGQCPAEHVGTAAKASLPIRVADDGGRRFAPVLGRREQAADRRPHAQHLEESTRDEPAVIFFRAAPPRCAPATCSGCFGRPSCREAGRMVPQLLELGVAEPGSRTIGAAVPPAAPHACRAGFESITSSPGLARHRAATRAARCSRG